MNLCHKMAQIIFYVSMNKAKNKFIVGTLKLSIVWKSNRNYLKYIVISLKLFLARDFARVYISIYTYKLSWLSSLNYHVIILFEHIKNAVHNVDFTKFKQSQIISYADMSLFAFPLICMHSTKKHMSIYVPMRSVSI